MKLTLGLGGRVADDEPVEEPVELVLQARVEREEQVVAALLHAGLHAPVVPHRLGHCPLDARG